jgi:PAS domain S-box-containing protein
VHVMKACWRKFKNRWKKLPIESRGSIAIAIPLLCLVGAAIFDTILNQNTLQAQVYVNRSNEVLVKSQSTLNSLLNAETGVRGYFIGKQKVFLEPYNQALTTLEPNLSSLEQLVKDNPAQVQQVKLLTQAARYRMSLLQQSVQRVDNKVISTDQAVNDRLFIGKRSMDQLRNIIEQFEAEQRLNLTNYNRLLQDQKNLNFHALWYGVVISTLGTCLTVRLLRQLAIELRERELRLRESRSLIRAIVANIVDGVMVINTQGTIETFNNAAVKMFGYDAVEVIGWHWQQLLNHEADATQKLLFNAPDILIEALPTGQIWQAMGQRKDGEWFPIEVSINSIAGDDDRIAIIRDISDRQQSSARLRAKAMQMLELNAALTASNESLLQSNQELDQFAYIAAHDLKAPLRAISSLSEWIEEDIDKYITAETRGQIHLLRSRVHRMQALLNSLLEYSRSGRRQEAIVMVDVSQLITQIIQVLAPPATFTIDIVSVMPTITTRRQSLKQVLTHLIGNTIRHHPTEMGIVKISVIDQGDHYEFAIADDGNGIEPQFQERIYTIFQTLKARDLQENVGAGLAIAKKIVIAEGGAIYLESVPDEGAIFRFTWLKQPLTHKNITTSHTQ